MTSTSHKRASGDGPWERENPRTSKGKESKHLTPAQKASAKRHAKAAGRPYPNLVDNMHAASEGKSKSKTPSKTTSKAKSDAKPKAKSSSSKKS